jgi:hypothetical protein
MIPPPLNTVTECFVVNESSGRRELKQARLWVFVNPEVPGVVFSIHHRTRSR